MVEKKNPEQPAPEPVWTYRGYQIRPGEFTTAMVHFFRAEVQRANIYRQRLDHTFNWAVITTAAALSFAFTETGGSHIAILLDLMLVTLFLYIESRRYRYYKLWSYRVRLLETDFFAAMLVPPFHPAADWAETLAESLLHPSFPVSLWEAVGRRLRRNYLLIYIVIGLSWVVKLGLHPTAAQSWGEFFQRAAIGALPGQIVVSIGIFAYLLLFVVSLLTVGLQQSTGEILPRFGEMADNLRGARQGGRAWFRPSRKRKELLTFIVTDKPKEVADRILQDMKRGATILAGTGAYTGEAHGVLMVALTVTEVAQLKVLVAEQDRNAFVIVSAAQSIFGGGFMPLGEDGSR
ncbi:MAG: DUF2270 domain-containing protein [Chloroflexota bacterium]